MKRLFTSESVTEGHPDKICDQISDAILDSILAKDPNARVACETLATTGLIMVAGEITTNCYVDIDSIARETVRNIGYDRAKYGFDCDTCAVMTSLKGQSPDIAQGVDNAFETRDGDEHDTGAGDQGMMFGFACDETEDYMPMPIYLAHKLTRRLSEVRKNGTLSYLRPDGKSQVSVEYDDDKVVRIDSVVISSQHNENVSHEQICEDIKKYVIDEVIPAELLDENTKKWKDGKYIAYFQAFTNTYAPLEYLQKIFTKASNLSDVVGIFIATRPDCITEDIAKFLGELNKKIYVCIELGFQTSKGESIKLINRCYENEVFEDCIVMLNKYNIDIIVHTILGLPYESKQDMLNTVKYVSKFNISGIKLQLLHIIKDTALHKLYIKNPFKILTLEEYVDIVVSCIENLPTNIVIHRVTGDGDKNTLVEPKWSLNKKVVLNSINRELNIRDTYQGVLFSQ